MRSPDTDDDDTSSRQTVSEQNEERSTEEIESSKEQLLQGGLEMPNMKDVSRYSLPANVKQNSMLDAKRKGFKSMRTTAVMSHLQMPGGLTNQLG